MSDRDDPRNDAIARMLARREFIRRAAAGTIITAIGGGLYALANDMFANEALAKPRADGRARLPPGQRLVRRLRPMGGEQGDPNPRNYRLKIHGAVERPYELDFAGLLGVESIEQEADVHCVTGWSLLGGKWQGARISTLLQRAGVKPRGRFVILEAAHGYTANVDLAEVMKPNAMVVHRLDGRPLARPHGAPVRALIPDRYFWKSAKWLTGIRVVERDRAGYWEIRGYHNRADPWLEERHG